MVMMVMLKGKLLMLMQNCFFFRGRVNVAEKLLTLRFPLFTSTQAETFTGKYHFLQEPHRFWTVKLHVLHISYV